MPGSEHAVKRQGNRVAGEVLRKALAVLLFAAACVILQHLSCRLATQGPSVPALSGQSVGVVGETLAVKVVADDPDLDTVSYKINWGDSTDAVWTAFAPSGETLSVAHVYEDSGNYTVKAKARNGKDGESEWSVGHAIETFGTGPGFPDSLLFTALLPQKVWMARRVALSPDGGRLYMSFDHCNAVAVLRTDDLSQIDSVIVGGPSYGMALSPDGSLLYVSLPSLDSIAVVRTSDDSLLRKFPAGRSPWDLALSPDGSLLYCVSQGEDDSLRVWRTLDYVLMAKIPVDRGPYAIALSATGGTLYVSSFQESTLVTVSTVTNSVAGRLKLPGHGEGVCASSDGAKVFVGTHEHGVTVISAVGLTPDTTIETRGYPNQLAVTPDGHYWIVANDFHAGFPVARTDANVVVGWLSPGWEVRSVAVSADGSRIYGMSADAGVCVFGRR